MRHLHALCLGIAVLLLAVIATSAIAADASGKWTWKQMRQGGEETEMTLTLKVEGEKLTGTLERAGRGQKTEITNGTVKDGELSFEVTVERGGNTFTSKYKGKVEGDTIKGTRQFVRPDGGEARTRDWEAKRAS
jgi:hypothetical protein